MFINLYWIRTHVKHENETAVVRYSWILRSFVIEPLAMSCREKRFQILFEFWWQASCSCSIVRTNFVEMVKWYRNLSVYMQSINLEVIRTSTMSFEVNVDSGLIKFWWHGRWIKQIVIYECVCTIPFIIKLKFSGYLILWWVWLIPYVEYEFTPFVSITPKR